MKILKTHKSFDASVRFWEHDSSVTKTKMKFSTFTPASEVKGALIWLSGLTCTDENFITKAGALRYLNDAGLMLICPDTSPRGLDLPDEHTSYDFGSGAGFYLNAKTPGYKDHYRMFDYIAQEIYGILENEFGIHRISISGHSMGGHGALIIGLKEAARFKSVSAFSPITNPILAPWGEKAFTGYLGEDRKTWQAYDACALLNSGMRHPQEILVDQGSQDEFLEKQLMPENLRLACEGQQKLILNMRLGYDHSYYFISTFIGEHIAFHARHLNS
jgi:S-formylglutathione hydrolase